VGLREVLGGQSRVLHSPTGKNAIYVHCLVVICVVDGGDVIHVWVEQVVEVPRLLVAGEIWTEELVVYGTRVEGLSEEGVNAVP
jgi:hypothetical protein